MKKMTKNLKDVQQRLDSSDEDVIRAEKLVDEVMCSVKEHIAKCDDDLEGKPEKPIDEMETQGVISADMEDTIISAGIIAIRNGQSPIPLQMSFNEAGKKITNFVVRWQDFQKTAMTIEEFVQIYKTRNCNAIALVTGFGYNPILLIDFDDLSCWPEFWGEVKSERPEIISKVWIESTPKGKHLYTIFSHVGPNEKLAMMDAYSEKEGKVVPMVRIETRGVGGLAFCSPSPRYVTELGSLPSMIPLTDEEGEYLLNKARKYEISEINRQRRERKAKAKEQQKKANYFKEAIHSETYSPLYDCLEDTPINRYNVETNPCDLLEATGWTRHSTSETDIYYTRPGKDVSEGISAAVQIDGPIRLTYVFTTNSSLEGGRAYTPFQLNTNLFFDDDEQAAFNSLLPSHNSRIQSADGTEHTLETNKKGIVACTLGNLKSIIFQREEFEGLMYNILKDQLEFTKPFLGYTGLVQDPQIAKIHLFLEENYGLDVSDTKMSRLLALIEGDESRRYNPFIDFLESLKDVTPLENWCRCTIELLQTPDNCLSEEAIRLLTRTVISRQYDPIGTHCESMLVIVGEQGTGKSTFFRRLGDPMFKGILGWFGDSIDLETLCDAKLTVERTRGTVLDEIGELKGNKRAESDAVKQALSTNARIVRPSYGRTVKNYPQMFTLCATTNNQEFLQDVTGNRRFIVLESGLPRLTTNVHTTMTTDWLKRFWKAAFDDYLAHKDEPGFLLLSPEAQVLADEATIAHEIRDPFEDAISEYINKCSHDYEIISKSDTEIKLGKRYDVTEVGAQSAWKNALHSFEHRQDLDLVRLTRSDSTKIGAILRKLCTTDEGWSYCNGRKDGNRTRFYKRNDDHLYSDIKTIPRNTVPKGYFDHINRLSDEQVERLVNSTN